MRDSFRDKTYDLEYPNAIFIKQALLTMDMHADIFNEMTMCIIRSNRYFIVTDNPVVFFVPPDKVDFYNAHKSLMSPHTEVFFPLSKNLAVTLNRSKLKELIMSGNREIVDNFNYNFAHNSFDYIFSPLRMNSLSIFVKEYIPYPFKLEIR